MATANESSSTYGTDRGVMARVREGATAQLSSQKDRATEGLGSLARAVRGTTGALRENQQETIAQYVDKAADQIDRFSTRLRERDVSELVSDAQQFARRQPAIFLGAAFAAGVLAARFLKSSSDERTGSYGYNSGRGHDAGAAGREYGSRDEYVDIQRPYSAGGL